MVSTTSQWTNTHIAALRQSRLARFGLVGALGALLNTLVLSLLIQRYNWHPVAAGAVATETAILTNFVLHDRWTFRHTAAFGGWIRLKRAIRYNAVALGGLAISVTLLAALVAFGHLHYLLANILSIAAGTAWNYVGSARLAWGSPGTLSTASAASLRRWCGHLAAAVRAVPIVTLVTLGITLFALAFIALTRPGPWAGLAVLGIALALASRADIERRSLAMCVLAPVVTVCAVDYFAWRLLVSNWAAWWVSVPLLLAEAFGALHALGLYYTVWPRQKIPLVGSEDPTHRPIYILIPTLNEDVAVLEPTLRGAQITRARYLAAHPHAQVSIVVCNDGLVAGATRWRETEALAARMGIACVTRKLGGGAKAGNIESARQHVGATGEALLVIFDADQVAEPDFLLQTVPPFADTSVGWVQTGQYYRNLDNPVARWAHDQQSLFYQVLCPGKAAQNAAFICGTNVVLRAGALDEIGGLPQDSVTEDFAASILLHPRWRSVFLPAVLARGLGPIDLQAYLSQQNRWATGTLGALRRHWRAIFLPGADGLSIAQRVQYALACTHYLCGLRDLIYVLAPLVFLLTGIPAVRGSDLAGFLSHFIPYWLASQLAFWSLARGRGGLRGIVLGFGSFPVLLGSLVAALVGRRIAFAVTAKQRRSSGYAWNLLVPHCLTVFACVAGLWVALTVRSGPQATISALWVVYTTAMVAAMLSLGLLDWRAARLGSGQLRMRKEPHGCSYWMRQRESPAWARLAFQSVALAIGVGLVLVPVSEAVRAPLARTAASQPFRPDRDAGPPRLGLSLPHEWLASRPGQLESLQLPSPALIGRTQDIHDEFDQSWAKELAAQDARPWVTLLFGAPAAPSLDASLPAIANGIHDEAIHRWARQIREFGAPVYLTILPHVDRNWSLSSAVANGGIPQDVPRVWGRVQSIFQDEGVQNVAWVWAPAAPADDGAYAPAESSLDAVLLTLISYPDTTQWTDPATAIGAVAARHPGKPILLEVSAQGSSERKASWLRAVATAAQSAGVHALIYHEGSPAVDAVVADHLMWSLASDPLSLQAVEDSWVPVSTHGVSLGRST